MFEVKVDKKSLEASKKILEMYVETVKREIGEELFKAAKKIETTAKQNAVTSKGKNAGGLRASIIARRVNELSWEIVAAVLYAVYVEFGTGSLVDVPAGLEEYALQFKGKGVKGVNLPARPFLFPAEEQNREQLISAIVNILKKG